MSLKICSDNGGSIKINFLVSPCMLEERIEDFHLPDNPSLCALLVQMKYTVADQYVSLPSKKESSPKPNSVEKINAISITQM